MVDSYLPNKIGNMVEKIIEFIVNISQGYILFIAVGTVGLIIYVIMRNFPNLIIKPKF
jgi:hypothetical protein